MALVSIITGKTWANLTTNEMGMEKKAWRFPNKY